MSGHQIAPLPQRSRDRRQTHIAALLCSGGRYQISGVGSGPTAPDFRLPIFLTSRLSSYEASNVAGLPQPATAGAVEPGPSNNRCTHCLGPSETWHPCGFGQHYHAAAPQPPVPSESYPSWCCKTAHSAQHHHQATASFMVSNIATSRLVLASLISKLAWGTACMPCTQQQNLQRSRYMPTSGLASPISTYL